MPVVMSADRLRFIINRFRDRLWVKPLAVCLLSIAAVFGAKLADGSFIAQLMPDIAADSINSLLSIMASSMLVIATFSVTSMVSAYASASSTATPRSFTLLVADNAAQNALSTFVGAFIFSIVALTAFNNDYFGQPALFVLFLMTVIVFGVVIMTFVRWVDRIARLGRLGSTVDKVEQATAAAIKRRRQAPTLGGAIPGAKFNGQAVFASKVGYVQLIDIAHLQTWAEQVQVRVVVAALPGTLAAPDRPLAYVSRRAADQPEISYQPVVDAFQIGGDRLFDDDPRFGLMVLSEIAGRALSPAVNDPGTAIDIIGTLLRLFVLWHQPTSADEATAVQFDRVEVPQISVQDMFDDAFTAIARDGAAMVEVSLRLQKALRSLAALDDTAICAAAEHHSQLALKRAAMALTLPEDLATVTAAAIVNKHHTTQAVSDTATSAAH